MNGSSHEPEHRRGNLAGDESNPVMVTAGIPTVPTGALVAWTGAKPKTGRFAAQVVVPGVAKPVKGRGVYLAKERTGVGVLPRNDGRRTHPGLGAV